MSYLFVFNFLQLCSPKESFTRSSVFIRFLHALLLKNDKFQVFVTKILTKLPATTPKKNIYKCELYNFDRFSCVLTQPMTGWLYLITTGDREYNGSKRDFRNSKTFFIDAARTVCTEIHITVTQTKKIVKTILKVQMLI
jgi:hypothetical protein